MILFIGQVGNDFCEREAFQEIDYRRMFGQMAKWVAQIDRTDRIPEYIARFCGCHQRPARSRGAGFARGHVVGRGGGTRLAPATHACTTNLLRRTWNACVN